MMNIQGFGAASAAYASVNKATSRPQTLPASMAMSQNGETQVTISDQARALAGQSANDIQRRLDEIKQKPALARTEEESEYVRSNDERFKTLSTQDSATWSADEVDYMQKAAGMVNTMAKLSPGEQKLYDEMIAKGDQQAAAGLMQVAMSRMFDGDVTLKGGKTFNPRDTEITAANVRDLFSQTIVDPSGQAGQRFDALAAYLDGREA